MPRQTPTRPASASTGFIVAQPETGRDRTWEKSHPTASYRIPADLRQAITDLAKDLNVSTSDLAALLLAHALSEHRSGRLRIKTYFNSGRLGVTADDE